MKKLLLLFLVVVLLLTGCGSADSKNWEPERASEEIEPYAKQAISIIDQYLNFEITSEEASKTFWELYERIEPLDIRSVDGKYSEPDKTIAHIIDMLAIGEAKDRTDLEYRKYRDVLAFQIGEKVSGYVYEAGKNEYIDTNPERKAVNELGIRNLPYESVFTHTYEAVISVSLYFDAANGVGLNDIEQYLGLICNKIDEVAMVGDILITYSFYEQSALYFSVQVKEDQASANTFWLGMPAMDGDETSIISEDLSEIMKHAKRYIGTYTPKTS